MQEVVEEQEIPEVCTVKLILLDLLEQSSATVKAIAAMASP